MDTIPYGYCHCGCGEKTRLSERTHTRYGHVKGVPLRYVHGHQNKRAFEYTEEDCGYESPCWIWAGSIGKAGYGVKWRPTHNKKSMRAHRYTWERENGPVPEGYVLHHLCETKLCCRPDHLIPKSQSEHAREHAAKLDDEQKTELVRLYAETDLTGEEIGRVFGVTQSCVSELAVAAGVRREKSWKHVNNRK